MAWDYTCPDTLAIYHAKKSTSKKAGKAASLAEDKKLKKYRHLNNDYYVVPVVIHYEKKFTKLMSFGIN